MEGIVRRIKNTLGADATVVATGGYGSIMSTHTEIINHLEPTLVLDGVRLIYEKNHKRNPSRKGH
jgi:type III pantothenate kinase